MKFILLLFFLWLVAMFHQREHRIFVAEMKRLREKLSQGGTFDGEDWRVVRQENGVYTIKRAFIVRSTEDKLRYAVPVLLAAVALIILQSWMAGFLYLAILGVKWFLTATVLDTRKAEYGVKLFGLRLFGEAV